MYRNIYYDRRTRSMKLWTWDSTGNRILEDIPYEPYLYVETSERPDATSIFNTGLRKKSFKTQYDRNKYVENSGIKRIYYNLGPEQQFLIDHYKNYNKDATFSKDTLKNFYIDIETDSRGAFPDVNNPHDPVLLITIYDSLTDHFHTWGVGNDYTPSYKNVTYYKCYSEKDMLSKFIAFWEADPPDILSGWNIETFDIPYMINRIIKILGEDSAKCLSPVHEIHYREGIMRFGKMGGRWYIHGVSCLDYMEVYKTFSRGESESYSLNYIAEKELGEGKLAINATSLAELAQNDWKNFTDYNIEDVNLIKKLETKLMFLKLVRLLAYKGMTQFEKALGKVSIVTGALTLQAHKRNQIVPTFVTDNKTRDFPGGFVMEPKRGLKPDLVSFDANSLYPNTIITLNISPETKMGEVLNHENGEVKIRMTNGKIYDLTEEKFLQFIKAEKIAISKAKIMYTQKFRGILPEFIDDLYKERVETKEILSALKKQLKTTEKGTEEHTRIKLEIEQADMMQYTIKIALNSAYGTLANRFSPFMDIDAAGSITTTGQAVVKQAGTIVNTYIKEKYDIDADVVIYSDTDSVYFTMEPILKHLGISVAKDGKVTKEAHQVVKEVDKYINTKVNEWAKSVLNSTDPRYVFKREAICDAGIFLEKKRYILHILDEEGSEVDKLKYVGVQVVRTTVPKKVKVLIKEIINSVFKTRERLKVTDVYRKQYEYFKTLQTDELAFRMGVQDYDKHGSRAEGFTIAKGTPIHVKASIYYNQLLKTLNLEAKYEPITGGKIKYFYAAPNRYGIKCLGYNGAFPPEMEVIPVDYEMMFEKLVVPSIESIFDAIKWPLPKLNAEAAVDLFSLFGDDE